MRVNTTDMRTFKLKRNQDLSGVSGTGIVAEGVVLSDGECVLHWLSAFGSISIYRTMDDLVRVHGHEGASEVVYD